MSESKTIRLSGDLHKMLKLASVEAGLSMQEFLKRVLTSHNSRRGDQETFTDCPLCQKYGREPNEETIEALKESRKLDLSKAISGKEALKRLDKEFCGK